VLNDCYAKVIACAPLMKRLRDAEENPDVGLKKGTITQDDHDRINEMQDLVAKVVAVDDFTPEELSHLYPGLDTGQSRKEAAE